MHKKNLIPQATQPVNRITIQGLPTELVELSDEALSQVWGGHYKNLCSEQWRREHQRPDS
jgi:bacteriocin leader peptide (microcyclamide/patellamide family)